MHFLDSQTGQTTEIAFRDARRLGRIRLCASPLSVPPISGLGFDPIHSMPPLAEFSNLISKRKGTAIKTLLLDQSFSAGIGNWVAGQESTSLILEIIFDGLLEDEVLYHAGIHPEQRCYTLSEGQLQLLHEKIKYVCETAISFNADDSKFPDNWLFRHRWVGDLILTHRHYYLSSTRARGGELNKKPFN